MVAATRPQELAVLSPDGGLDRYFHPGQWKALTSRKRFVVVLAGTQSGKTSFGPHWLHQEMREQGPGDYMVVTPTFTLLELKALPEFKRLFVEQLRIGTYQSSPIRRFVVSPEGEVKLWGERQTTPTVVYFGYAEDPDSLESATIKALWADEAGQKKFKRASWEALQRRLSLNQGRALFTTTPYDLGWLKSTFWDPWVAANNDHPEIEVVNFPSTANPKFPQAELDRAREQLPRWKFRMFYLGLFERPAGLIYDCWDETLNTCPPFTIPDSWPRYLGMDFGGVNTAGLFVAEERNRETNHPTGKFYAYREYHAGGRTAARHVDALMIGEPMLPTCIGGSRSEGQWREEFGAAGLPIGAPFVADVEVGINRMYGLVASRSLVFFSTLTGTLDQIGTYSRELDVNGDPTEKIEDKDTYHYLDAGRYICTLLGAGLTGSLMA